MAISIIPKENPKLPSWVTYSFYSLAAFLIFSFVGYFILNNTIKNSQKSLEEIRTILNSGELASDSSLKQEILSQKQKIDDFAKLVKNRFSVLEVLPLIEKVCHPDVWFSSLSFSVDKREVSLKGEAKNFESLGQQIYILEEESAISDFEVANISSGENGKISFDLSLKLAESLPENE